MPKTLISETFEELVETGKQVGKGMVQAGQDLTSDVAEQAVGRPRQPKPKTKREKRLEAKIAKMGVAEEKKTKAELAKIREELTKKEKFAQAKRQEYLTPPPQLPPRERLKLEKKQELVQLEEKKKKELPPPVSAAKPKMGTAERERVIRG